MTKAAVRSLLQVCVLAGPLAGVVGYKVYTGRPAYLLAQGRQAAVRGDFQEAARFAGLLDEKGQAAAAHLLRGEGLVYAAEAARGDASSGETPPLSLELFRRALAELGQVKDDGPAGLKAELLAGECLMYLRQPRPAEDRLRRVLDRDPDNVEAHRLLAAIYMDLNSPKRAVTHFRAWARLDPDNGIPHRWIGFFQKDMNQVEEAAEAYREALKRRLPPEFQAAARKELAHIYCLGEGEYQEALDVLAQGPAAFQDDADVLALRIDCLRNLPERKAEAVGLSETALRQHADDSRFLRLRAQLFLADDQPDKAVPLLERAVQRDAYDFDSRLLLVDAYRQLKQDARADEHKRQLQQVQRARLQLISLIERTDREPWNDQARVELAALCVQMNNPEQARTWLRAALVCNPDNAKAKELLEQLPREVDRK